METIFFERCAFVASRFSLEENERISVDIHLFLPPFVSLNLCGDFERNGRSGLRET